MEHKWLDKLGYYDLGKSTTIKALFYGAPGVGKTRLAASFPNTLFLDSDGGGRTLKALHIPFIPIKLGEKNIATIEDVLRTLEREGGKIEGLNIETVVFDSITSLADAILWELMKYPRGSGRAKDPLTEKAEYDHWMMLQNTLKDIFKRFDNMNFNLVGTCGEKLERDEALGTYVGKPNIQGGYRDVVGHQFDEWYYMATQGSGDNVKYYCFTKRYGYFQAKSRDDLPAKVENPSYGKLFMPKVALP